MRPSPDHYSSFNKTYVDYTTGDDLHALFNESLQQVANFLTAISVSKADYAYADGKWTLKELLQHCIDTERIMSYRALCVARGEMQNLPGFDENAYADVSNGGARIWEELIEEMLSVRKTTIILFNSLKEEQLQQHGMANNHITTCNAIGFIIIGHFMHHERIVRERYL